MKWAVAALLELTAGQVGGPVRLNQQFYLDRQGNPGIDHNHRGLIVTGTVYAGLANLFWILRNA